jgi:hypothetical protein
MVSPTYPVRALFVGALSHPRKKESTMASGTNQEFNTEQGRQQLAAEILEALKGIRFGTVEITVHDGRVVQIDRRERFRYQLAATSKAA